MARALNTLYRIVWKTETISPLSIGSWREDATADIVVVRDGLGRILIPGTSIAGVLQDLFPREMKPAYEVAFQYLFGTPGAKGARALDGKGGSASLLSVADVAVPEGSVQTELRDGIGIDRFSGAADDEIKFVRQVVPGGVELEVVITVEVPKEVVRLVVKEEESFDTYKVNSQDKEYPLKTLLQFLCQTLETEGLILGGGSARGMGYLKPVKPQMQVLEVSSRDAAKAYWGLRMGLPLPEQKHVWDGQNKKVTRQDLQEKSDIRWTFTINWKPTGPFLVKAGSRAFKAIDDKGKEDKDASVDMVPLSSRHGKSWRYLLPGSSVRGSFRSYAERVVRSLLGQDIGPDDKRQHHEQLWMGECFGEDELAARQNPQHLTARLFGVARPSTGGGSQKENQDWDKLRIRGSLKIRDTYNKTPLPESTIRWQRPGKTDTRWGKVRRHTHNAVDRWTGGAQDSALYTILSSPKDDWDKIEMRLEFRNEEEANQELALFFLLLRAMAQGQIPLGYGTRRGYGAVGVSMVEVCTPDTQTIVLNEQLVPVEKEHARAWKKHTDAWKNAWVSLWKKQGTQ